MTLSRTGKAVLFTLLLIGCGLLAAFLLRDSDPDKGSAGLFDGGKVGVITIEGPISSSDELLKQLKAFRKKSSVKAILLRINSPGGTVAPAQEIYTEIARIKQKKKPVVVSMETLAASAAYYIASNADVIVCSKGTITGSIGVIMMLPDLHKVIEKVGVDVSVVKAGKFKDIGSSFRPMTVEERAVLQGFASQIHEQFITDVVEGRKGKVEADKLREVADGRFFTGEEAQKLGLVDQIGNFYDAVKIAAELGGIKGDPELVYPKKKWDGYLDLLAESTIRTLHKMGYMSGIWQSVPVAH